MASFAAFCFSLAGTVAHAQDSGAAKAQGDDTLTINWYHGKEYFFPVAYQFERETGIKLRVTDAYDKFDTDVIMAADYYTLDKAARAGKFAKISTPARDARVPSNWRDDSGTWYGVSVRLRAVVYNPQVVKPGEITTIYDLAKPRFAGRICLRSALNEYNRSMLATMIAEDGEKRARDWAVAVRRNGGSGEITYKDDMTNIVRLAQGECDVAIVNTYYLGYMQEGKIAERYKFTSEHIRTFYDAMKKVDIAWLDQQGRGNFANVTGIAINADTKHRADAEKLVDFLISDRGQKLLTDNVFKYPTVPGIGWSDFLLSQGRPRIRDTNLNALDAHFEKADAIYAAAGWK